jgi:arylsulfatase
VESLRNGRAPRGGPGRARARRRLSAEEIRDVALTTSGLLACTIGGRSVYPYQPDHFYRDKEDDPGEWKWPLESGADLYRRGLYTFIRRTTPNPSYQTFDAPSRGGAIWHEGWKAITTHPTISGWSHFETDTWELYHTDVDRSEIHDLAAEMPDKLQEMVNLWYAEAGRNDGFPLDDRSPLEILTTPRPQLAGPRSRYVYYPDTAEIPEAQSVNVRNRSFSIGALVDIPAPGAQGVLFAHGARFGGHALYVKDNRLHYVNSFVGMFEQKVVATEDLPTGEKLILAASFEKDGEDPPHVSTGILSLYHGDQKVGEARIKTQPGMFSVAGEGLCVGRDSSDPVTTDYPGQAPYRFTGGVIHRVAVDVSGDPYVDLEREAVAMLARE